MAESRLNLLIGCSVISELNLLFRQRSISIASSDLEPAMSGPNKYKAWVDTGKLDMQNIRYSLLAIDCQRKMFAWWGKREDLTDGPVKSTYGRNPRCWDN